MSHKDPNYHLSKSKEHYWKNKESYRIRNQLQKDRSRALIAIAKEGGCICCTEKELCALDFHHLGDKDMVISQMLGMKDERLMAEIAKCVVLCANCHRKHHNGLLELPQ